MTDLPVAEAANRVRGSGIRDDLLAALDGWSALDARAGGPAWKGLLAVAQAADDHPWRRECRDAVLRGDRAALVKLARREDSPRQPVGAVLMLAGTLAVPPPGRRATAVELAVAGGLLEKAGAWHRGDADIAFGLASWFPSRPQLGDPVAVAREHIDRLKKDAAGSARLAAEYVHLGGLLAQKGDLAGRAAAFRQAVQLMPGHADYRTLLVGVLQNKDELLAVCSDWIQSGPPSSLPYLRRGMVYAFRGQRPQALADYIKATELGPQDALLWQYRAGAHNSMRQFDEALAAYMKAIEAAQRAGQNPAWYWHLRACTFQALQQWDKAIADATQAIDLDPKKGDFWASRGDFYRTKGDTQKALADYDMAVKNPSSHGNPPGIGLYRRAELNEQLGRWNAAIADWTECMARTSVYGSRGALVRLLVTCPDRALRDPRRAMAIAKQDAKLGPEDIGFYLAMAQAQLGNHDEAQKWYDKTVQWMEKNAGDNRVPELRKRQGEAKDLLASLKKKQ